MRRGHRLKFWHGARPALVWERHRVSLKSGTTTVIPTMTVLASHAVFKIAHFEKLYR
jgi:hypothetical protein